MLRQDPAVPLGVGHQQDHTIDAGVAVAAVTPDAAVEVPKDRKKKDRDRDKAKDGTTAEVKTPWFKKMQHGSAYALFLTEGDRPGTFATTGVAQGVFGIPTTAEDRTVKVHSGLLMDFVWKYQGMNVYVFLKELKQAVKTDTRS